MVRITLDKPYIPIPVLVAVKYGLLYNWYAATDARLICADGWDIQTYDEQTDFITYLGGQTVAGGKLKETGFEHWISNTGATNEVNYNGRGAGIRSGVDGSFSVIGQNMNIWSKTEQSASAGYGKNICIGSSTATSNIGGTKKGGFSLRPYRAATAPELLLPDGAVSATYTGNDLKIYRCTKINDRIYVADNLCETKFRNGDWIPGFDGGVYTPFSNAAWAALTTGALCAYNNDWDNV